MGEKKKVSPLAIQARGPNLDRKTDFLIFQGILDFNNNEMDSLHYTAMNTLTSPGWQRSPGTTATG